MVIDEEGKTNWTNCTSYTSLYTSTVLLAEHYGRITRTIENIVNKYLAGRQAIGRQETMKHTVVTEKFIDGCTKALFPHVLVNGYLTHDMRVNYDTLSIFSWHIRLSWVGIKIDTIDRVNWHYYTNNALDLQCTVHVRQCDFPFSDSLVVTSQ